MSAAPDVMVAGLRDPMLLGEALFELLGVELTAIAQERASYQTLNSSAILERAREKELFQNAITHYHSQLSSLLSKIPSRPPRLKSLLAAIRKRSKEVARHQLLNRRLAERTLDCVNGYLRAVAPQNNAYDRRGIRRRHLMGQARQSHGRLSRKV